MTYSTQLMANHKLSLMFSFFGVWCHLSEDASQWYHGNMAVSNELGQAHTTGVLGELNPDSFPPTLRGEICSRTLVKIMWAVNRSVLNLPTARSLVGTAPIFFIKHVDI